MSYTEVTVSGYNASPPPDDGTQVAANEVTWAGIKSKIGDPIKTAFDTCQTNITAVVSSEIEVNDWAPATTARLFYQAAAPTNWTKSVTDNDKTIRIVSGLTGGTAGGTTAFSSVMAARTITLANLPSHSLSFSLSAASHSHSFSGTTSSDGSHSHTYQANNSESPFSNAGGQVVASDTTFSASTSSDGSHSHTYSGTTGVSGSLGVSGSVSLGGSGSTMDFAIQYMDCIVATKD